MTGIMMIMLLVMPMRWSIRMTPIQTSETCWSAHLERLHRCQIDYPDSTSIQRAVCEAASAGQYTACIGGIP